MKLLLKSNFSSFPQYFQYISNFRSQITCSFVKWGCSSYLFPTFANLICRDTDISKYFRQSLELRDNESFCFSLVYVRKIEDYFLVSLEKECSKRKEFALKGSKHFPFREDHAKQLRTDRQIVEMISSFFFLSKKCRDNKHIRSTQTKLKMFD